MEEMEAVLKSISDQNSILQETCTSLESEKNVLNSRNIELEQQIEALTQRLNEQETIYAAKTTVNAKSIFADSFVGCRSNTTGSAESKSPLLQELEQQSTLLTAENEQQRENGPQTALWKIIALCLIYRTCSKTLMPADWKNLPKAYSQMSSQTWQKILQQATQLLPKVNAPRSECLDQWWGPKQSSWNPQQIPMQA